MDALKSIEVKEGKSARSSGHKKSVTAPSQRFGIDHECILDLEPALTVSRSRLVGSNLGVYAVANRVTGSL